MVGGNGCSSVYVTINAVSDSVVEDGAGTAEACIFAFCCATASAGRTGASTGPLALSDGGIDAASGSPADGALGAAMAPTKGGTSYGLLLRLLLSSNHSPSLNKMFHLKLGLWQRNNTGWNIQKTFLTCGGVGCRGFSHI
ncbi:hypothetical protein GOP47_0014000 [Adiantum capillus-veneris]|uniref:Uncharacterized protein n=1 Tax=Adiantum capillus-veneris TaxID=13818 RepID=A0A9D4UPK8_ADICA|nr:hypothetical protein GOP47_0014000 [Adiantum capillus-veneris]